MRTKRLTVLAGCILLISAGFAVVPFNAADAESKKPIELSYAYYGPSVGVVADGIRWWVDEVNKRTGGAVNIKIFWGGTLARSMEIAEAVRTGTADIGDTVWAPYFPQKFPLHLMADFAMPFFRKPLAKWLAMEQLVKEFPEFDQELADSNIRRITYYGVGKVDVISRRPIRQLEDFKGRKIRCSGKTHPTELKAVGAVPIFIPSVEAYDALQKGVVDGSTCTARWAVSYKYHEAAKYLTSIGMGGDPCLGAMINLDVWNKLPESVQRVFLELREEYPVVFEEMLYKKVTEESYKELKEAGVEFIDLPADDLETWKNLPEVKSVPEQWMAFAAEHGKVPESRLREIHKRYSELLVEYGRLHPRVF